MTSLQQTGSSLQVCRQTGSCDKFVGRLVHVTSLLADWLMCQVCSQTGSSTFTENH